MPLPEPSYIRSAQTATQYRYWIAIGVILVGTIIMNRYLLTYRTTSDEVQTDKRDHAPPSETVTYPSVPVKQGIHQLYTSVELVAPFRIVTPAGTDSYYIKVTDASSGVLIMAFFVQGNQSFEADVPAGTYRIKYATGSTWYGVDRVFGPDTRYSEVEKTFEFSKPENQSSDNRVELVIQRGDNLHTKSISANQFNCNLLRKPTATSSPCP